MNGAHGVSKARAARRFWALLLLMPVVVCGATAVAAEFVVQSAETYLADKVYHLNADIDYDFSAQALEALHNGVPLVVQLDIEIDRARNYVWNENIAALHQRYQLGYEALIGRYVITNLNSGADAFYPTLDAAIDALGRISDLPLLDADLLNDDERYQVSLRASLDLEALPVPMRIMGYFSSDWRISSEWFRWSLE